MEFGRTFIDGGFRPAIIKAGHKWTRVVFIDGSRIRVKRTRRTVTAKPIAGYTLSSFAKRLLRPKNSLGLKMHISRGARDILEEAIK